MLNQLLLFAEWVFVIYAVSVAAAAVMWEADDNNNRSKDMVLIIVKSSC